MRQISIYATLYAVALAESNFGLILSNHVGSIPTVAMLFLKHNLCYG